MMEWGQHDKEGRTNCSWNPVSKNKSPKCSRRTYFRLPLLALDTMLNERKYIRDINGAGDASPTLSPPCPATYSPPCPYPCHGENLSPIPVSEEIHKHNKIKNKSFIYKLILFEKSIVLAVLNPCPWWSWPSKFTNFKIFKNNHFDLLLLLTLHICFNFFIKKVYEKTENNI